MSDYISRQAALIKSFESALLEHKDGSIIQCSPEFVSMAVEILKELKAWQWVPCSERLPKIGKQVLCCDSQSRVFTSALTEIASNGMTFFGRHCKVIAWMPLPEPYKGEES